MSTPPPFSRLLFITTFLLGLFLPMTWLTLLAQASNTPAKMATVPLDLYCDGGLSAHQQPITLPPPDEDGVIRIGDRVWHDINGNGLQDGREPGVQETKCVLCSLGIAQQVAVTRSDQNGLYTLELSATHATGDQYYVLFLPSEDYGFTTPDVGGDQGQSDFFDSDVDPETGQTPPFIPEPFLDEQRWDAGLVRLPSSCIPPPEGMVAWWPFDELSGDMAADIAEFPNDGFYANEPTPQPGVVQLGLAFNGDEQYVKVEAHEELDIGPASSQGDFSIDTWVRISDTQSSHMIVDKLIDFQGYSLYIQGGQPILRIGDGDGELICAPTASAACTEYFSGSSITDNEWHHLAVTVDRDQVDGGRWYLDGVEVGIPFDPTFQPGSLSSDSSLYIGTNTTVDDMFLHGILDELELFKRVLTAAEISELYHAGAAGKCKGAVHGMKYNDLNGNGEQDTDEPGLPDWTITLTDEAGNVRSTTTGGNGNYSFIDLPTTSEGISYTVAEQFQLGWQQTYPATGTHQIVLGTNYVIEEINFGNTQPEQPTEYCHLGWDVHLNPNWDYVEVYMSIFNDAPATYDIELLGLPGLDGLTDFTLDPPSPLNVNGYQQLLVNISPLPDSSATSGPYQAIVTNLDTGTSFGCSAQIWDANNRFWIDFENGGMQSIPFGDAQEIPFTIQNVSTETLTIDIQIDGMFMAPTGKELTIISLDGNEPGTPITGSLTIPISESVTIPVQVAFTQFEPIGVGDIILSVDSDGDNIYEGVSSVSIRSVLPPSPTPSPSATASPSATPTATSSPSVTATSSPSATASVTATSSPSATATSSPTATPSPTMTAVNEWEIYLPIIMR